MLPGQVLLALALVIVANIAFEFCEVFYNAFLPDIAPPERIGRVSGLGWGLGYVGGLLALVVALVTLVQPEVPWFGFTREAGENIRATNLLVAVWLVVFSLPLFLWVPEDKSRVSPRSTWSATRSRSCKRTFTELRKHEQTCPFLARAAVLQRRARHGVRVRRHLRGGNVRVHARAGARCSAS